jgi:hypothetical protein
MVPQVSDAAGLLELAIDEIARLEERQRTVLVARDDSWRAAALDGTPREVSPESRKYRLYNAQLRRTIQRLEKKLMAAGPPAPAAVSQLSGDAAPTARSGLAATTPQSDYCAPPGHLS